MASEKEQSDLDRAQTIIRGLGLGHEGERERPDTTGYRGTKDGKPIESRPSDIEGLTAALTGKTAAAPETEDTSAADAAEEVEAPASVETETPARGEDMDKVRRFLTLKKVPAAALDAMSDEELASMRVSLLEADHQRARLLEETVDLRAKTEKQTDETAEEVEPKRMVPATTEDLDAKLKALVDDGELSEGAAKALSLAISASNQAVLDQVQERLAPIEEQGESARVASVAEVQRVKAELRAEVGERFLGLDGSDATDGIDETFTLLASQQRFQDLYAKDGREATIRAIWEATAGAHGLEAVDVAGDTSRKRQRRTDRANGTTTTTSRASGAAEKLDLTPEKIAQRAIRKALSKPGATW